MQRLMLTSAMVVFFGLSGTSVLWAQGGYDPFASYDGGYDTHGHFYYDAPKDITGEVNLYGLSGGVGIQGAYYGGQSWRVVITPNPPPNNFEQRRGASWAYVASKRNPR